MKRVILISIVIALLAVVGGCQSPRRASVDAQVPTVVLKEAPALRFRGANSAAPDKPGDCDCNSPAHWDGSAMYAFNSAGHPWRSAGPDYAHLDQGYVRTEYNNKVAGGRWIEATWKADNGVLYGWYHFEPAGLFPGTHLTSPRIGAVRSTDNGANWQDLGVILDARPKSDKADTKNYYFAGGNGDFSILVDPKKQWVFFFISTYAGDISEQGVSVARMRYADRDKPVGAVWKWHAEGWKEPGLGGRVTPIFTAAIDWHRSDADALWGPSMHYNTHLRCYVMLLNRSKDFRWAQEGVYVSFNSDLGDPKGWSKPQKILGDLRADQWYPQVLGMDAAKHETDKLAGRAARLFLRGESKWEIVFFKPGEEQKGGK